MQIFQQGMQAESLRFECYWSSMHRVTLCWTRMLFSSRNPGRKELIAELTYNELLRRQKRIVMVPRVNSRCSSFLWSTLMPWLYLPSSNSRRDIATAEKHLSCNEPSPSSSRSKSSMPIMVYQNIVWSVGISDTKRRGSRHHRNANAERKR
jgi:hypothetical protein